MSFCQFIAIEHDFLFSRKTFFFSGINRVIFPGFKTSDVVITIVKVRHRFVVFLNSSLHFFKQCLLKNFSMRSHFFVIRILFIKIIYDFWIFPVIQPKVIINSHIAEFLYFFRYYFGDRGLYFFWHILSFEIC